MISCDVLVVGGGPAGSSCAWKLRRAGLDVIVMDRSAFPRDKVCGGWITPQVVEDLCLDIEDYAPGRTLQPVAGFLTGMIGGHREIETTYEHVVSFGIRRCEFDDYLLRRSGARLRCSEPITSIRRQDRAWLVNDAVAAPMLVGAGGHFCPVARWLNAGLDPTAGAPLVVAQEVELALDPRDAASFPVAPGIPELYFCRDLKGYGWCFRKQNWVNVGLGRADPRSLPGATSEFVAFLEQRGRAPRHGAWRWRGHAYLLHDAVHRRILDAGVLLIGDAAGLAYPQSGEGIRPAVESGLLAAVTILEARGRYTRERLESYEARLGAQLGTRYAPAMLRRLPPAVSTLCAGLLLRVPGFVRHVALDRWFLHTDRPPVAA